MPLCRFAVRGGASGQVRVFSEAAGSRRRSPMIKTKISCEGLSLYSQKDTDALWTKKHGKSHYGYLVGQFRALADDSDLVLVAGCWWSAHIEWSSMNVGA